MPELRRDAIVGRWVISFRDIVDQEREDRSRLVYQALGTTLRRPGAALGDPHCTFMLHSDPLRDPPSASHHRHLEVTPALTHVAGSERGSGFHINPVPPEEAAASLRKVAG